MKKGFKKLKRSYMRSLVSTLSILALTIAVLLVIVLLVQDIFNQLWVAHASELISSYKVTHSAEREASVEVEMQTYKDVARIATASGKRQNLTKEEAKEMIERTFPSQYRERFKRITMECENGKLDTGARNTNKDGSHDVGMSQINDKWHRARVEKMFGMDFDTAMAIPLLNYIYAAYLVEHDQNFHQWACDRILK